MHFIPFFNESLSSAEPHWGIIALCPSWPNKVWPLCSLSEWGLSLQVDDNVPLYWTELIYGTLLSASPLWDHACRGRGAVKGSVLLCGFSASLLDVSAWMRSADWRLVCLHVDWMYFSVIQMDADCNFIYLYSRSGTMPQQHLLTFILWGDLKHLLTRRPQKNPKPAACRVKCQAGRLPIMNHYIPTCGQPSQRHPTHFPYSGS